MKIGKFVRCVAVSAVVAIFVIAVVAQGPLERVAPRAKSSFGPFVAAASETVVSTLGGLASPGSEAFVSIQAEAVGLENTFDFSIEFDPAVVESPVVALGPDIPAGQLTVDTETPGLLGVHISLPSGIELPGGTRQIAVVTFNVLQQAPAGDTALIFGDAPMRRAILDTNSKPLSGLFTDGTITILEPEAPRACISGFVRTDTGEGINRAQLTLIDENGFARSTSTNQFGWYIFTDVPMGGLYTMRIRHNKYSFRNATILVRVVEDVSELNFVGDIR